MHSRWCLRPPKLFHLYYSRTQEATIISARFSSIIVSRTLFAPSSAIENCVLHYIDMSDNIGFVAQSGIPHSLYLYGSALSVDPIYRRIGILNFSIDEIYYFLNWNFFYWLFILEENKKYNLYVTNLGEWH